jgi:hypothetical protein
MACAQLEWLQLRFLGLTELLEKESSDAKSENSVVKSGKSKN